MGQLTDILLPQNHGSNNDQLLRDVNRNVDLPKILTFAEMRALPEGTELWRHGGVYSVRHGNSDVCLEFHGAIFIPYYIPHSVFSMFEKQYTGFILYTGNEEVKT